MHIDGTHMLISASITSVHDEDTRRRLHKLEVMVAALCEERGIVVSNLPGINILPARRSNSPSIQSASSSGVPMETLTISDTRSNTSSHSSAASKRPTKTGKYYNSHGCTYHCLIRF
jgi:hypothetical protein